MTVTITATGYIELLKDGSLVSRHTQVEDAIESAIANGEGSYRIRYPERRVEVALPVITATRPTMRPPVVITGNPSDDLPTPLRTLYVNAATGDDSRTITEAQNPSTPWATIHRAVKGSATAGATNASQAAAAGDLVLIAPGTYWETGVSGDRFDVKLNPVNSGTASSPIVFRGNGGRPEIRQNNGIRGPIIGANARSYIVWDSVKVDDTYCGSTSDTGPVGFFSGASYCRLLNSEICGHNGSYYWGYATFGGNYRLVGLEDASNCIIKNNKIYRALNTDGSQGGQNEGGVLTYDSPNNIIEQNTFYDCGVAVFIKGLHAGSDQGGNIVRRNNIYNCFQGIRALGTDNTGNTRIYQNIVRDTTGEGLYAGFDTSRTSKFFNNTVYNCARGRTAQGGDLVDVRFYNNIFAECDAAHYDFTGVPSGLDVYYDRNLYYNNTYIWQSEGGGNQTTLSGWQGLSATKCDPNGSSSNPSFVDAAANNFRLQGGSSALTLGRDYYGLFGGDSNTAIAVGAYVTGSEQIGADW